MASITRSLRLNPWSRADVEAGKEPSHFDYHEPDSLDDFINKAGGVLVRLSPQDFGAAGAPSKITITITGNDNIEETNQ